VNELTESDKKLLTEYMGEEWYEPNGTIGDVILYAIDPDINRTFSGWMERGRGDGMIDPRIIQAADLFCGAGGTSSGLYSACEHVGARLDLVAVDHWKIAVETHTFNHPDARHICATLEGLDPRKAVPSGRLDILVASPECTHHSNARGGKPVSDQLRASAWHILRWAELLQIDNILIENVREFQDWGPTDATGKPIKSRKGETFKAFCAALRSLNYTVEHRVLNAADYGDPTSRHRLFIMARRGGLPITWPLASHGGEKSPYRTAREIIDWDLPGESIFRRKKALAPRTLARIAAGIKKYGGDNAEPFLTMFYGSNDVRSVDRSCPTITASGNHIGLCQPLRTLITQPRFGLCEPFVIGQQSCAAPRTVDEPLPTIATAGAIALVEPEADERGVLDIRFRMLQPHELAAAMSFGKDYVFEGNKTEVIKQIGNAVPVRTAAALCGALLQGEAL
jgi:DNA (cytosine-5)-methyltransferase 1